MDINRYLKRISFEGDLTPNLNLLSKLQKLHLSNIPFENLDIHFGVPIVLNQDKIYNKIVCSKRGGFCYELNGLFYSLLHGIGFDVKMISARVFNNETGFGEEFDHMALIVKVAEHEFLSDVGFGEFAFAPLKFVPGIIQTDERGKFVIERHDSAYFRVDKLQNGETIPQYLFSTAARKLTDFSTMCEFHQTSPKSHFTQKRLISRPTETGRITLTDKSLKITENGIVTSEMKLHSNQFDELLLKWFELDTEKLKEKQ